MPEIRTDLAERLRSHGAALKCRLNRVDDLTQLYNSRYLSQTMRRERQRASRSVRPLHAADIAMYWAKARGRNGIHVAV